MQGTQPGLRYATLDGLRGAAALLVVFVHFPMLCHVRDIEHGHLAIDLFFVMSGFVIGSTASMCFMCRSDSSCRTSCRALTR